MIFFKNFIIISFFVVVFCDKQKNLHDTVNRRYRRAIPLSEVIRNRFFPGTVRTTTTTSPPTTQTQSTQTTTASTVTSTRSIPTTQSDQDQTTQSRASSTVSKNFNNPHFFPNRNGIVELFEWKFSDIARECEEFLGPNGFGGVQVSPVTENIILPNHPWYEMYQPISYNINTRLGDASDFFEMSLKCNDSGVRIYVDVVLNHMAGNFEEHSFGTAGSYANPFLLYYPMVPYNKNDFYQPPCEITNSSNVSNIRNCDWLGLHNLNQSRENVKWSIILLLNKLIALGATGFRIGAAKYMWPDDLKNIYEGVNNLSTIFGHPENSKPFIYQEVDDNLKFTYANLSVVTEFDHAINMADIFKLKKKSITMLNNYPSDGMLPSEVSLTFVDNHDLQRKNSSLISFKDEKELKAAYVFTLGFPYGIPRIMSSFSFDRYEQGPPHDYEDENIKSPEFDENGYCKKDWICEHRWNTVVNMIKFRNAVGNNTLSPVRRFYTYENGVFSFCRGNKGFIVVNTGEKSFSRKLQTCLPKGTYCDIISGKVDKNKNKCTGKSIQIDYLGRSLNNFQIQTSENEAAIVLLFNSKL